MKSLVAVILFSYAAFAGDLLTEGIVKSDLKLEPDALVKEYVQRDADGAFLGTNDWWNAAVACPACMGGPDTFTVISSYAIKKASETEFTVTYQVEGAISGNTFTPKKAKESQSFTVVKTDWGYKLDNKAYQMVRADVALNKYKSDLNKKSVRLLKAIKVRIAK